jgi:hypothetical protein
MKMPKLPKMPKVVVSLRSVFFKRTMSNVLEIRKVAE